MFESTGEGDSCRKKKIAICFCWTSEDTFNPESFKYWVKLRTETFRECVLASECVNSNLWSQKLTFYIFSSTRFNPVTNEYIFHPLWNIFFPNNPYRDYVVLQDSQLKARVSNATPYNCTTYIWLAFYSFLCYKWCSWQMKISRIS